ncbi:Uncharacterized membrane protein [Limimonas halophila]|uniref:Uncharacterized membrane protein n=1 Tax=Limimonas halophila TaxID=1082479 RepID=A0A1G7RLQ9_9PROT|nr:CopD family protein [Limimonas halophila]SDG11129.1 Uncharacterized membrane protein [Limimonas halophila]
MPDIALALALHALAAVVWVGGMAFAYAFVRPALGALEPPARQALWRGTFARFFPVVWVSIAVLLASGYYVLFQGFGGFAGAGMHVHLMHLLAWVMTAIFAYVFFGPWRRFKAGVDGGDPASAKAAIERIRVMVAINLTLGLIVVAVGASGRYWG